jgi:predicted GNAT family N-acyltransferase
MFQLHVYRISPEMPLHFYYQVQSFTRIFWVDGEQYDIEYGLTEPAMHVVLAKEKSLISYTAIIWREIELKGYSYKCYGLSGVMTFPAFRRRGFAGQVVDKAVKLIREDPSADIVLLWTAHHNVHFYTQHGWTAMPNITTTKGDPAQPEVYDDEMRMMLFLSDKAISNRADFEQAQLYIGEDTW